jgi:hypothetical protein
VGCLGAQVGRAPLSVFASLPGGFSLLSAELPERDPDVDVIIHACPNLQAWCRTRLAFIWLNPLLCVGSLGVRHQSADRSMRGLWWHLQRSGDGRLGTEKLEML